MSGLTEKVKTFY